MLTYNNLKERIRNILPDSEIEEDCSGEIVIYTGMLPGEHSNDELIEKVRTYGYGREEHIRTKTALQR